MNLPTEFKDSPLKWSRFADFDEERAGYEGICGSMVGAYLTKDSYGRYTYSWGVVLHDILDGRKPQFNGTSDTLQGALDNIHKAAFNMMLVRLIYGKKNLNRWRESIFKIYNEQGL